MFKYLAPMALFAHFANPAAAQDYSNEFGERPATKREASFCNPDKPQSGQYIYLGPIDNPNLDVEILLCYDKKVWQLSCEMAEAVAGIMAGANIQRSPDLETARENGIREFGGASQSCNGLFLG
ncbi:MAG: hypothetical protein AAF244_00460 [Pseudomonadota bacterium]